MELLSAASKAASDCIGGIRGAAGWLQGRTVSVNVPGAGQENACLTDSTVAAAAVVAILRAYASTELVSSITKLISSSQDGFPDLDKATLHDLAAVHLSTERLRCLAARHDGEQCIRALSELSMQCIVTTRLMQEGPVLPAVAAVLQHAGIASLPSAVARVLLMATAVSSTALAGSPSAIPVSTHFRLLVAASSRSRRLGKLAAQLAPLVSQPTPLQPNNAHGPGAMQQRLLQNLNETGDIFDAAPSDTALLPSTEAGAATVTGTVPSPPPPVSKAPPRLVCGVTVGKLGEQLAKACVELPMPETHEQVLVQWGGPAGEAPPLGSVTEAVGSLLEPVCSGSPQLLLFRALCTNMGWGWVYRAVLPQVLWPALQAAQPPCPAALLRWGKPQQAAHATALATALHSAQGAHTQAHTAATDSRVPSTAVRCARAMRCLGALLCDALHNAASAPESASVMRGTNNVLARFVELLRQCAPVPFSAADAAARHKADAAAAGSGAELPVVAAAASDVQCGLPFICQLEMVHTIAQVWSAFKSSLWPSVLCAHALGGPVLPAGAAERQVFHGMSDELWEGVRISYATLRQAVWGASDWCIALPRSVREALPPALLRCTLAPPRGAVGKVSDVQVPASTKQATNSDRRPLPGGRGGKAPARGGAARRGGRGRGAKRMRNDART